ncbi:MAG: rhodanese-like domain-containing protein [Bacteroidota bacterium]
MGIFSSLFGKGPDFSALIAAGATIVDVRSPAEFSGGHIEGALNIPLGEVPENMADLKKLGTPVIVCCASGMRSGRAKRMLKAEGIEVYNGGGWTSLRRHV